MINVIYCINITDLFFFLPPSFCLYPYPSSLLRIMIDDLSQQHHHINHPLSFLLLFFLLHFDCLFLATVPSVVVPARHLDTPPDTGREDLSTGIAHNTSLHGLLLCPFMRTKPPCKDEGDDGRGTAGPRTKAPRFVKFNQEGSPG